MKILAIVFLVLACQRGHMEIESVEAEATGDAFLITAVSAIPRAKIVPMKSGSGPGYELSKLCSDGATCERHHVYIVCVLPCNYPHELSCIVVNDTVEIGTVLTWSVSESCDVEPTSVRDVSLKVKP